jgi:hypothetical protein
MLKEDFHVCFLNIKKKRNHFFFPNYQNVRHLSSLCSERQPLINQHHHHHHQSNSDYSLSVYYVVRTSVRCFIFRDYLLRTYGGGLRSTLVKEGMWLASLNSFLWGRRCASSCKISASGDWNFWEIEKWGCSSHVERKCRCTCVHTSTHILIQASCDTNTFKEV